MITLELQREIEQFLYAEARLLDDGAYREWLDLFTDDTIYWMPVRETRAARSDGLRKAGDLALFEDDKIFLGQRIERIESGLAHAEEPPSRTRHFISNVEVSARDDGGLDVRSNILVYQLRLERTESTYVGRREDMLRPVDDCWKIARRMIALDQTLLPRSISIFF